MENDLKICEELYYHCQFDSRYVFELTIALKETGIVPNDSVEVEYKIKESFKEEEFYKKGLVFFNEKIEKSRKDIFSIPESFKTKEYEVKIISGKSRTNVIFDETDEQEENKDPKTWNHRITIKEIADLNYSFVNSILRKYSTFKFNRLKSHFPNLQSTKEFITSNNYLGDIKLLINSSKKTLENKDLLFALNKVIKEISEKIESTERRYIGTTEFKSEYFYKIFKDKKVHYTNINEEGVGISQNSYKVKEEYRVDLEREDWYIFNDNYGTTEEKKFVAYFKTKIDELKEKYKKVFLVRNERQLAIYSFKDGERFEPDYLLFLIDDKVDGLIQYQIFIEPKGEHLLEKDAWKEQFLLELKNRAIPTVKFVDDNNYKIWGLPFFNKEKKQSEFNDAMEEITR